VDADYTAWASAVAEFSVVVVYCENGKCIEKCQFIASNFLALMNSVDLSLESAAYF